MGLTYPSKQLHLYTHFIVRSKKYGMNLEFHNYSIALLFYQSMILKSDDDFDVNDLTLEGKTPKEMHTIWYTFEGQQKPYSFLN